MTRARRGAVIVALVVLAGGCAGQDHDRPGAGSAAPPPATSEERIPPPDEGPEWHDSTSPAEAGDQDDAGAPEPPTAPPGGDQPASGASDEPPDCGEPQTWDGRSWPPPADEPRPEWHTDLVLCGTFDDVRWAIFSGRADQGRVCKEIGVTWPGGGSGSGSCPDHGWQLAAGGQTFKDNTFYAVSGLVEPAAVRVEIQPEGHPLVVAELSPHVTRYDARFFAGFHANCCPRAEITSYDANGAVLARKSLHTSLPQRPSE